MHRRFLAGPRVGHFCLVMLLSLAAIAFSMSPVTADHESLTRMTFEPVENSAAPTGSGTGMVEFHGGQEPDSRWTSTFQFFGVQSGSTYSVVVQGRFGEDGSSEAVAFTPVCEFVAGEDGSGGCWYYFVGLHRLGVVQLRVGSPDGAPVLQATNLAGPGSMNRTSNAYSLTLTATPGEVREATPDQELPATPES